MVCFTLHYTILNTYICLSNQWTPSSEIGRSKYMHGHTCSSTIEYRYGTISVYAWLNITTCLESWSAFFFSLSQVIEIGGPWMERGCGASCGNLGKVSVSVGWEKRRENAALFAQESGLGCISCCCSLESSQGYTWLWERQALQQMTFTCIIILSRASYRNCVRYCCTYPLMEIQWYSTLTQYIVVFSPGLPHIILDT